MQSKERKSDSQILDTRVSCAAGEQQERRSKLSGVMDCNRSVIPLSVSKPIAMSKKLAFNTLEEQKNRSSLDIMFHNSNEGEREPLLDTIETSEQTSENFDELSTRKRSSVALSMRIKQFDSRRAERMSGCCSVVDRLTIKNRNTGELRYKFNASIRCKDRLCPYCAKIRARKLSNALTEPLKQYQQDKDLYTSFLTLTFRNTEHLREFAEITAARKKLLKSKFWKKYGLVGSIGSVEVKLGEKSHLWHSHFHLVVFTHKEIPTENKKWTVEVNQELSNEWKAITGDSFILRGVSFDGNYNEILKYISKGTTEMSNSQLEEFCNWSKGRRFLFTTGELYNNKELKELIKTAEEDKDEALVLSEDEEIIETARLHYFPTLKNFVVMSVQTYESRAGTS